MSGSFGIFFLWVFIVKINNRAIFYVNRFGRSIFSKKRRIWRKLKQWWRQYAVKNVGIAPILLWQVFNATIYNCDDFWKISFSGTMFFQLYAISPDFGKFDVKRNAFSDVTLVRHIKIFVLFDVSILNLI